GGVGGGGGPPAGGVATPGRARLRPPEAQRGGAAAVGGDRLASAGRCEGVRGSRRPAGEGSRFPRWVVTTRAHLFAPPQTDVCPPSSGARLPSYTVCVLVFGPTAFTRTGLSGWHTPCDLGRP